MRILLTIEYDGKNFNGWQIQPGLRTVQGTLKDALEEIFGQEISLQGSGRTDAGVHALGQKAHFDIEKCPITMARLPLAVNVKLPDDVSVVAAEEVPDTLEAQYSAKRKTYRYDFYLSRIDRPLWNRAAQVKYSPQKFDVSLAKKALLKLVGTHDFKAFSSTGRPTPDTTRTIFDAHLEKNGDYYSLFITGNGFLYNMVRIIAGTVVEIALSLRPLSDIDDAFATGNRLKCGKTYPPQGLTLLSVEYKE